MNLQTIATPENICAIISLLLGGYYYSSALSHKIYSNEFYNNVMAGTVMLLFTWAFILMT